MSHYKLNAKQLYLCLYYIVRYDHISLKLQHVTCTANLVLQYTLPHLCLYLAVGYYFHSYSCTYNLCKKSYITGGEYITKFKRYKQIASPAQYC